MKKFRIILALILALFVAVAVSGYADKTIEEVPDDPESWQGNWNGPDGATDIEDQVHYCEQACYVCDKCLDVSCGDVACAEKCSETDSESRSEYVFNGTNGNVSLKGGVSINGDYLGNINQNPNVVITYRIYSPEATTVCLGATISEMPDAHFITSDTPITVNGEAFYSRGYIPAGSTVWTNFVTGWLGCVDLVEGDNYIVIKNPHSDGQQYNFKDIRIMSAVALEWRNANTEHECTSANAAGKCTDYDCNLLACLDKDETDWEKLNIYGKDDEVLKYYIDGQGTKVDLWNDKDGEKCIGQISGNDWNQKIIWSFNATEETYIRLSLETSTNITKTRFADLWDLTLDGQTIDTEGVNTAAESNPGWATYTFGTVAYAKVGAGDHTFMMVHKGTAGYNLRSLDIAYSNGNLTKIQAISPDPDQEPEVPDEPITEGTEFFFEAETAAITAGALGDISVNTSDANARNNTSLGNVNNNSGATLTFTVDAAVDCKAGLYLSLAFGTEVVENIFTLQVNGEPVRIPSSYTGVGGWATYREQWLANIDLKANQSNTIVLTVTGGCGNFDYMKLVSPNAVTPSA